MKLIPARNPGAPRGKIAPRFNGHQAVQRIELLACIRLAATKLARNDLALRDDLQQHALLAVLEFKGSNTFAYWRSLANWRMRDYFRRELRALNHLEITKDGAPIIEGAYNRDPRTIKSSSRPG